MPKKKTAPTAASARRQETVAINAVERASQAITILRNQLPDPDAAAKLSHLFVQLAGILSSQLGRRAKSAMPAADVDVVRAMVQLATSLLNYLHANLEEMVPLLANIEDWPAVASINPVRDARRVVKYPESAAAKLYKPVTEHLGTRRFFPPVVSKKRGICQEIAEETAYIVYFQGLLDDRWRERGLPVFLILSTTRGCCRNRVSSVRRDRTKQVWTPCFSITPTLHGKGTNFSIFQ